MAKRVQENGHANMAVANPPTHEEDPILDVTEVARQLGRHPVTIKRWIDDGLLVGIRRPSGISAVRKSEVNRFLGGSALKQQVT